MTKKSNEKNHDLVCKVCEIDTLYVCEGCRSTEIKDKLSILLDKINNACLAHYKEIDASIDTICMTRQLWAMMEVHKVKRDIRLEAPAGLQDLWLWSSRVFLADCVVISKFRKDDHCLLENYHPYGVILISSKYSSITNKKSSSRGDLSDWRGEIDGGFLQ